MVEEGRLVVAAGEGEVVLAGGFGVVGKVSGKRPGGAFSIVEHPLEPGVLLRRPTPTPTRTRLRS
jgi:hypothetical protein